MIAVAAKYVPKQTVSVAFSGIKCIQKVYIIHCIDQNHKVRQNHTMILSNQSTEVCKH